jgi:hypothetical protein
MAPAVANPLYMGYRALYKTILEDSKRGIAKAIRVFADKDNYPVLIHCIHGNAVISAFYQAPCICMPHIVQKGHGIAFESVWACHLTQTVRTQNT